MRTDHLLELLFAEADRVGRPRRLPPANSRICGGAASRGRGTSHTRGSATRCTGEEPARFVNDLIGFVYERLQTVVP
jgi:hypothetical protein